jgi:phosphinothricin acetyltransferase
MITAIVREIDFSDEEDWRYLLEELSPNNIPKKRLDELLVNQNFFGAVVDVDGFTIGFGSISFFCSSLKGLTGIIEDIIIIKKFQGCGYGRKIIQFLLSEARNRHADQIILTSNPKREAARRLYESEGFQEYSTGVFVLKLDLSLWA